MARPDNRYVSSNDYGRRTYIADEEYADQMGVGKRPTAFTQNTPLYQQSLLKKPYLARSFEDMEYDSDPNVGTSVPNPGDPSPDNPAGPIQPDVPYSPWTVRFLCWGDPCYSWQPDEMHCETITCIWPIYGYEALSAPGGCQYQLNLSGVICGSCPENETFWITFNVLMKARFKHAGATVTVIGRYYNMKMSHCRDEDEDECGDDTGIVWNDGGSADTIAREASVTVAISNPPGTGFPYTWSVAGTGFWFDEGHSITVIETVALSTLLYADDTACGTATITVTGCGSTAVTGYVRCTTGTWVRKSTCNHIGVGLCPSWLCSTETIIGNQKITQNYLFVPAELGQSWCEANWPNCVDCGCITDYVPIGTGSNCPDDTGYTHMCKCSRVYIDEWECA